MYRHIHDVYRHMMWMISEQRNIFASRPCSHCAARTWRPGVGITRNVGPKVRSCGCSWNREKHGKNMAKTLLDAVGILLAKTEISQSFQDLIFLPKNKKSCPDGFPQQKWPQPAPANRVMGNHHDLPPGDTSIQQGVEGQDAWGKSQDLSCSTEDSTAGGFFRKCWESAIHHLSSTLGICSMEKSNNYNKHINDILIFIYIYIYVFICSYLTMIFLQIYGSFLTCSLQPIHSDLFQLIIHGGLLGFTMVKLYRG